MPRANIYLSDEQLIEAGRLLQQHPEISKGQAYGYVLSGTRPSKNAESSNQTSTTGTDSPTGAIIQENGSYVVEDTVTRTNTNSSTSTPNMQSRYMQASRSNEKQHDNNYEQNYSVKLGS